MPLVVNIFTSQCGLFLLEIRLCDVVICYCHIMCIEMLSYQSAFVVVYFISLKTFKNTFLHCKLKVTTLAQVTLKILCKS